MYCRSSVPMRTTDIWVKTHEATRFSPPLVPIYTLTCFKKKRNRVKGTYNVLGETGHLTGKCTLRTLRRGLSRKANYRILWGKCEYKDSLGFIQLQSNKAQTTQP